MAKETSQRLKQTLFLLFLGVSIVLIAVIWVEGYQELDAAPSAQTQDRAPTAIYEDATPEPSGTRLHEPGHGRRTRGPDAPLATPTRDVADEEM